CLRMGDFDAALTHFESAVASADRSERNRDHLAAALHAVRTIAPMRDRMVEARQKLRPRSAEIVARARGNMEHTLRRPRPKALSPCAFWGPILQGVVNNISALTTAEAALLYLTDTFTINLPAEATQGRLPLYYETLKAEFPHFATLVDQVECSPYLA